MEVPSNRTEHRNLEGGGELGREDFRSWQTVLRFEVLQTRNDAPSVRTVELEEVAEHRLRPSQSQL
jgi:hypothetical protein